jgi:hypothetical protein
LITVEVWREYIGHSHPQRDQRSVACRLLAAAKRTGRGNDMKHTKAYRSFEGATALAQHAVRAKKYLEEVCAACEVGDRAGAQRALRQAISELETARAGLRPGNG